ncbi:hypothetical protein EGI22_05670 [Lacihabitans sp. LS3-19]|uniref:hypothetical protein n=1 Tax=Lacihabitans sp. LS3-19 TaxID=2487335 RepID=UPI0020CECB26|nr:hypothetical protein [Lacihabitans sp. LS3-19]MCP9767390.1 hypothetical protein [Lacihabitans sp. LS3-19]
MKALKLLIFFLPLISFAQEDFGKLYYPEINKAELAYTQDDYQASFTHYASAFSAVKKPLARDIFNAVVCKFMLKDFEGAKPMLLKLAQKGIPAEDLEQKEMFQIEGIKAEWANFRFVYEQFYSILEEKKDQDFIENINTINELFKQNQENSIFRKILDNELKYLPKDSTKNVDDILKEKELILKKNLINSELYHKAQNFLVDYVIKNGFNDEESSHVKFGNFYRNELLNTIQDFRYIIVFTEESIVRESDPFSCVSSEKKELFDQKVIEAVKNGVIHRDVASQLFLNFKEKEKVIFKKINIENSESCSLDLQNKNSMIYYSTKVSIIKDDMKYLQYSDLFLDNKLLFEKAKYSVLKNQYFLITSNAFSQFEITTVPNCEVAQNMIAGATIVQEK